MDDGDYSVSARHWFEENFAMDLMAGGNIETVPNPVPAYSSYQWSYGLGVGIRRVVARPEKDVFIELIALLSFEAEQSSYYASPTQITQSQDLSLFLGPGFEAFLPFWENLSVEASIGLVLTSQWLQTNDPTDYGYSKEWQFFANVGNNNTSFSPLTMAVHFYF